MTAAAQQKDLFTKKWRKVKAPEPLEHQLQIALLQHLHYRARPDLIYFHVPNGELRDKPTAAKLKAMGVLAGVADLVFIWPERNMLRPCVLFLELKAAGRRLSEVQGEFCTRVRGVHCHYDYADNIDDALKILQQHHLLKR